MQTKATLEINISSYWHPGTGKGSGSHLDALVERDRYGLPFVSGKMLKGLFRDAVNRLECWNRLDDLKESLDITAASAENAENSLTEKLFGSKSYQTDEADKASETLARDYTQAGILRFSDATFSAEMQAWLGHTEQEALRQELFRDFYSTAIQYSTGVAKKNSLRGMEMAIPVTLFATISWRGDDVVNDAGNDIGNDAYKDLWQEVLLRSLPLIRAVGGHRTRGFGRAQLSLQTDVSRSDVKSNAKNDAKSEVKA